MLAYSAPEGAAGLQVIAASDTEAFCRQFVLRLVSMQGLTALTIQAAVIKLAKNTTMRFIGLTVRFSNRWFNYTLVTARNGAKKTKKTDKKRKAGRRKSVLPLDHPR